MCIRDSYIIPLLFVYTPILFEGPLIWVAETVVSAVLGLYCFAVFFEGFLFRNLNIFERALFSVVAFLLIFPNFKLHLCGYVLFALVLIAEKLHVAKKEGLEKTG